MIWETAMLQELFKMYSTEQWSQLVMIAAAILGATQIVKVSLNRLCWKKKWRMHKKIIHIASIAFAVIFSYAVWDSADPAIKLTVAAIAWGIAWFLATYGLFITKVYFPKLHRVIQADRRKRSGRLPPELNGNDRRKL